VGWESGKHVKAFQAKTSFPCLITRLGSRHAFDGEALRIRVASCLSVEESAGNSPPLESGEMNDISSNRSRSRLSLSA
jgi:hypothetical protein